MSDDDGKRISAAGMATPAAGKLATVLRLLRECFRSGPSVTRSFALPHVRNVTIGEGRASGETAFQASHSRAVAGFEAARPPRAGATPEAAPEAQGPPGVSTSEP